MCIVKEKPTYDEIQIQLNLNGRKQFVTPICSASWREGHGNTFASIGAGPCVHNPEITFLTTEPPGFITIDRGEFLDF